MRFASAILVLCTLTAVSADSATTCSSQLAEAAPDAASKTASLIQVKLQRSEPLADGTRDLPVGLEQVETEPLINGVRKLLLDGLPLMASVPGLDKIEGGQHGSSIIGSKQDSGRLYVEGNILKVRAVGDRRFSRALPYTQQCADGAWTRAGVADVEYFTCATGTLWFAGFRSNSSKLNGFGVHGYLVDSNPGKVKGGMTSAFLGGFRGYFRKVYGAPRFSINQVVAVPSSNWKHDYSASFPQRSLQELDGTSDPVNMLLYVLFAGPVSSGVGAEFPEPTFGTIPRIMLDL